MDIIKCRIYKHFELQEINSVAGFVEPTYDALN